VRVFTLVPLGFFITSVALPAWAMLIYWMVLQLLGGLTSVGGEQGGVAFWAHVGGFVMGVVWIKVFERTDRVRAHARTHWEPDRIGWR
jgi:membrane associated rhomboid family serine protease